MTSVRRRTLEVGGITVAILLVLVATDTGPAWTLVVPLALALAALWWLVADALERAQPGDATAFDPADDGRVRSDARTRSLRISLMSLNENRLDRLHASLTELVDEQLAVAYGIDRATQPDDARSVMGEELHDFVNDPEARPLSFRRLERIVSRIEGL